MLTHMYTHKAHYFDMPSFTSTFLFSGLNVVYHTSLLGTYCKGVLYIVAIHTLKFLNTANERNLSFDDDLESLLYSIQVSWTVFSVR